MELERGRGRREGWGWGCRQTGLVRAQPVEVEKCHMELGVALAVLEAEEKFRSWREVDLEHQEAEEKYHTQRQAVLQVVREEKFHTQHQAVPPEAEEKSHTQRQAVPREAEEEENQHPYLPAPEVQDSAAASLAPVHPSPSPTP